MKIVHGTAFGTGGGCIAVIGETDNGLWFFADNIVGGCEVLKIDVRTTCEQLKVGNEDDDMAVFWINPGDDPEYFVDIDERELDNAFYDFCVRFDCKELGITDGYEEYGGGLWGDLCDYFEWSEYKIDQYSKPIHFKDIISERLDNAVNDIIHDIQNRLEIEEENYNLKAKEKLVDEIIKLLDKEFDIEAEEF